jgi:hypothetical protein
MAQLCVLRYETAADEDLGSAGVCPDGWVGSPAGMVAPIEAGGQAMAGAFATRLWKPH